MLTNAGLPKDVDFKGFTRATIMSAGPLFGAGGSQEEAVQVQQAWVDVQVLTSA